MSLFIRGFCLSLLIVIVGLFFFDASEVQAQQSNRLQYYGVDEVQVGELPSLAAKGVNVALIGIWADDLSTWQEYLDAAEAVGIKMIIWPLGSYQGSSSVPWRLKSDGSWDISDGRAALEFCQDYIESGGQGLLAMMSLHEPFWSSGLHSGRQDDEIRSLYSAMKAVAPDVPIFTYIDDLNGYENQGFEITDGMCDWCAIWQHTMCHSTSDCQGAEGRKSDSKADIRADRELIDRKGLNMKLLYVVQTFAEPAGYIMPSYDEAYNFTCEIIAENNLDAIIYYSWRPPAGHYTDWLQKHYAQNKELKGLIENVYADCVHGLTSPQPSPSLSPQCRADLSGDGSVNLADIVRLLSKWGQTGDFPEDLNNNGRVDLADIQYILTYWGESCQ